MGDKTTLARARQELENLYLGVPDDSVDLSFKDLTSFQATMSPIHEEPKAAVTKSPSLDFAKGLRGTKSGSDSAAEHELRRERLARGSFMTRNGISSAAVMAGTGEANAVSVVSMASAVGGETGRRRRPGIPHSNICALCSVYIYVFRHRCLVCGRVYCRDCVSIGMGDMSEGRKCVECLGRRFSQRYIKRAGHAWCCWRYPSRVKLQELKWAEKGPRRSGERRYRSQAMSAVGPRLLHASRSGNPSVAATPRPPAAATPGRFGISHDSSVASFMRSPSPHGFPL
ncbi:unnamed protein product [Musa hybrid cultivar]